MRVIQIIIKKIINALRLRFDYASKTLRLALVLSLTKGSVGQQLDSASTIACLEPDERLGETASKILQKRFENASTALSVTMFVSA